MVESIRDTKMPETWKSGMLETKARNPKTLNDFFHIRKGVKIGTVLVGKCCLRLFKETKYTGQYKYINNIRADVIHIHNGWSLAGKLYIVADIWMSPQFSLLENAISILYTLVESLWLIYLNLLLQQTVSVLFRLITVLKKIGFNKCVGGTVVSWLAHLSLNQALRVQALAGDINVVFLGKAFNPHSASLHPGV